MEASVPKNTPGLWAGYLPFPTPESNKYSRGHAVVMGGGLASTGASKIAARSALRAGAGLVSVACDAASLPIYAASFQAIMTKNTENVEEFSALISDWRVTAVLLGPACGVNQRTRDFVLAALTLNKKTVLDADAIGVFEGDSEVLFSAIKSPCILTPHAGEFARIFGDAGETLAERIPNAGKAAKASGAVVILKGYNTIIATPEGNIVVNENASPYLATAGSGDALAGICVALLAGGMPAFEAACASVWIHGEAGKSFGAGLIAEDIPDLLPQIMRELISSG